MESSGAAVILFFVVISITVFCYACARRNHGEGIDAGENDQEKKDANKCKVEISIYGCGGGCNGDGGGCDCGGD
jgi:hypothetical protein